MKHPFRRSGEDDPTGQTFIELKEPVGASDEATTSPSTSTPWRVRVEGIPSMVPQSTVVTLRNEGSNKNHINLATMPAALGGGVQIFLGEKLPGRVTIDIAPAVPRPGAEHRRHAVKAWDFKRNEDSGAMEASVPWEAMAIVSSSLEVAEPRLIPVEPVQPAKTSHAPVLIAGLVLIGGAVWMMYSAPRRNPGPRPRANPSKPCCRACARGAPCASTRGR